MAGAGAVPTAGSGAPAAHTPGKKAGGRGAQPKKVGAQATASGGTVGTESKIPWIIAGVMFVSLTGMILYPLLRQDEVALQMPTQSMPLSGGAAAGGGPGAVDLSSMTPRQAADRLYDRVMGTMESGDTAGAVGFMPMAIQAYQRAEPLDNDGIFHLSMLQSSSGDAAAAIETAQRGLDNRDTHLLLLYALGEAHTAAGDVDAAADAYGKLLDVWDEEIATGLPDYTQWHGNMMPSIERRAREVAGR